MKISGVKIIPILVSAFVVYLIGFLIYGAIFEKQWKLWTGISEAQMQAGMWKMALGWIMPIALSFGIAKRIHHLQITNVLSGAKCGFMVGVFLIFACQLYNYVYSPDPWMVFALDSFHIALISTIAGAILTAMKVAQE